MSRMKTFRYVTYCFVISFLTFLLVPSVLAPQIQSVDAGGKSPYESGYDHGCNDADISAPDDRYINQEGKGPAFHTEEFMQGYNAGSNACSGGSSSGSSGGSGGGSSSSRSSSSRTAFDDGYADGREARLSGGSSKAYCDPYNSAPNPDAYCALYKSGYAFGWAAADALYGDQ
jgi:hypothetical protein